MPAPIAPWRWIVALFALSAALGIVLGVFSSMVGGSGPLAIVLMGLVVTALSALMIWLSAKYWGRIDEAAREAHKWAWFWGANIALLPALIGFILLVERPDIEAPLWPGFDATPAHYVATGGLIVIGLLGIGYGLAWLGWWFWKGR